MIYYFSFGKKYNLHKIFNYSTPTPAKYLDVDFESPKLAMLIKWLYGFNVWAEEVDRVGFELN